MSYHRRFDPQGADSLAKLARWVRPGTTLLELGAASGYFTEHLAALGCTVDVIDVDREAASAAAKFARRSVVADLDGDAWIAALGDARYDAIVCADVLEHLRDGAGLLRRLRPFLAEGGELLLSVPNVAHGALVARLIDDRFEYGGEGLLDATHVRLYTWRSLAAVLEEAGWHVLAWDATTLSMYGSEFRVAEQGLDPALHEALMRRPHALVYQWLARAAPGVAEVPLVPGPVEARPGVPVRVMQAVNEDWLSLDNAPTCLLPLGGAPTRMEWTLVPGKPVLRLLLADRPGVIEVHALSLLAGSEVLWSLEGDPGRLPRGDDTVHVGGGRFALAADGAWIAPDLPGATIARADRLLATLAWPASVSQTGEHAAFAALAAKLHEEQAGTPLRRRQLVAIIEQRDAQLAASRAEAAALMARATDGDAALAATRLEVERLERAVAAQERIVGYRQSVRWWLKLPFVRTRLAWRRLFGG